MLKKAGILVAVAAAGVVALTPMAFAHGDDHQGARNVDYTNVEKNNLGNDCEFGQEASDVEQTLTGSGGGLLSALNPVTGAVIPADVQTQALNCNNIGVSDVLDSDSNNTSSTVESTDIEDSGNTVLDD